MPKSKEFLSSSESDSDGEVQPKKAKKTKVEKKPEKKDSEEKKEEKKGASKSSGDGEVMFELSKNRFVSVQEFRGKKLVGIREYYDKDGEQLPGRKGISLTVEQWNKLKACMGEIDDELGL